LTKEKSQLPFKGHCDALTAALGKVTVIVLPHNHPPTLPFCLPVLCAVAPAQTLTDKEYQRLRDASLAIIREMGVECGGSNVQMAVNPEDGACVPPACTAGTLETHLTAH